MVMRCTRRGRPVQTAPPEGSPSGATTVFVVSTQKYQGVKEFHMLARIGCNCKIMVFSPFITYHHSFKGNK